MFMNLAKGKKDLKTLILKDKKKKKKKKKKTVLLNMGRRFRNNLREDVDLSHSPRGGENQEERRAPSPMVSDNDTDFDEDQYPPAEDRYKQLEDRLSAMEIQKIPGLDFEELGLASGVVITSRVGGGSNSMVLLSMRYRILNFNSQQWSVSCPGLLE